MSRSARLVRRVPMKPTTRYVAANGINYYCEIHGTGEPLLLLHGGLMSIDLLGPILPALAEHRQVIAVDLHGHGRTALGSRPMRVTDIGDDLASVIETLGYRAVDVIGYSFGANVAFRLAVQHPASVRRLVLVSGAITSDSAYPEIVAMQAHISAATAEMMKGSPPHESYVKVAPHPEQFPALLDAVGELGRTPYDWRDDAKRLTVPTMLVYGDADMVRLEAMIELYKLIGGGQRDGGWQRENMPKNRLAILPDLTHYEMFDSRQTLAVVLPFVDGVSGPPRW